jgi:hypothetical protein
MRIQMSRKEMKAQKENEEEKKGNEMGRERWMGEIERSRIASGWGEVDDHVYTRERKKN